MAMESTQYTENLEECNSSESGWTMYLASPMHDDDHDDDGDGEVEDAGNRNKYAGYNEEEEDEEEEDSMASDASSGPACCRQSRIRHSKYNKLENANGRKKNHKVEMKKDEKTTKGSKKKEQRVTSLHGNSKVKKKKTEK